MDKVLSWIPKSIPQEPFLPYIGALRYPVVTTEQKPDVILSYLDIALNHAYQIPYPFMHDFQYADYESDQKEQYILDQIHEAINHHQFAIGFHQIIDQIQNHPSNILWNDVDVANGFIKLCFHRGIKLFVFRS
jgi:hypothetical protein